MIDGCIAAKRCARAQFIAASRSDFVLSESHGNVLRGNDQICGFSVKCANAICWLKRVLQPQCISAGMMFLHFPSCGSETS